MNSWEQLKPLMDAAIAEGVEEGREVQFELGGKHAVVYLRHSPTVSEFSGGSPLKWAGTYRGMEVWVHPDRKDGITVLKEMK